MCALKALLFDVDGTLAETERNGHRVAFNQAFKAQDLPWHWDTKQYGKLLEVAGGNERISAYARSDHPQWMAHPDATARIDELHAEKNNNYIERVRAGHIHLRAGVVNLIQQAVASKLKLGIVTTTYRGNVDALLAATMDEKLRKAFSVFVTGERVTRKKPDPECYEMALRELHLPAAAVLAIEDSPNGLHAAKAAGIRCLVVPSLYFRGADFNAADRTIDEFTDTTLEDLR